MKKVDLQSGILSVETFQETGGLTTHLDGDISPDPHEGYVRIHPNPLNKHLYYRCPLQSIVEVYQWTEEELLNSELYGQRRFRTMLHYGSFVQRIEVNNVHVGIDPLVVILSGCGEKCSSDGKCISGPKTSKCGITSAGVCYSADPAPGCG